MSVIALPFGNAESVREARIGNVTFALAKKRGYCETTANQLARQAKRDALGCETPNEVALRIVPPKQRSAMRPWRGPTGSAA